jgi:hypothetical protein
LSIDDYTAYSDDALHQELRAADDAARRWHDKAYSEYKPMTSGFDEYMQWSGQESSKAAAIRRELERRGIHA